MLRPGDMQMVLWAEIEQAFDDLIAGTKSREEIHDWAFQLDCAYCKGLLEFAPPDAEDIILRAISCLMAADLMYEKGEYLHSMEQFLGWATDLGF